MANGGRGDASGFQLEWQNLIMAIGLVIVLVGGFWSLAYIPIQRSIDDLKHQIDDLREADLRERKDTETKYLTIHEHIEYKTNAQRNIDRLANDIEQLRQQVEQRRAEAATRQDVQNALNTTRVEFQSEIKRLDELIKDHMKRTEFEAWKGERDKLIRIIQERQNKFSETLDSMNSRTMQQLQSYPIKDH